VCWVSDDLEQIAAMPLREMLIASLATLFLCSPIIYTIFLLVLEEGAGDGIKTRVY